LGKQKAAAAVKHTALLSCATTANVTVEYFGGGGGGTEWK